MKIPWYVWVGWAVVGLAIEAWALANGVANDTLTETITHHVPGWLVFMGIGWFIWHMLAAYQSRKGR